MRFLPPRSICLSLVVAAIGLLAKPVGAAQSCRAVFMPIPPIVASKAALQAFVILQRQLGHPLSPGAFVTRFMMVNLRPPTATEFADAVDAVRTVQPRPPAGVGDAYFIWRGSDSLSGLSANGGDSIALRVGQQAFAELLADMRQRVKSNPAVEQFLSDVVSPSLPGLLGRDGVLVTAITNLRDRWRSLVSELDTSEIQISSNKIREIYDAAIIDVFIWAVSRQNRDASHAASVMRQARNQVVPDWLESSNLGIPLPPGWTQVELRTVGDYVLLRKRFSAVLSPDELLIFARSLALAGKDVVIFVSDSVRRTERAFPDSPEPPTLREVLLQKAGRFAPLDLSPTEIEWRIGVQN